MNDLRQDHYRLRDDLVAAVERDLVGPAEADETLPDAPLTTYPMGVLFPADQGTVDEWLAVDPKEEDAEDGSGAMDVGVTLAAARFPSSIGLSFAVDEGCPTIIVRASAAKYLPVGPGDPLSSDEAEAAKREVLLNAEWRRTALALVPVEIDLVSETDERRPLGEGLSLFSRVRRTAGGPAQVTVALINTLPARGPVRDLNARFQCAIEVDSTHGAVFVERRGGASDRLDDEDLRSNRLLYRHARTFAAGHGCAARWEGEVADRKTLVATSTVPRARVAVVESNPLIGGDVLDVRWCVEAPRSELLSGLRRFASEYAGWIDDQDPRVAELDPELRPVAAKHLERCRDVCRRLDSGIDLLDEDEKSLLAFRLMNEAMLEQRRRTDWIRAGAPETGPSTTGPARWRPFQLGFILLCVRGVADVQHADRDVADLLWFPTGGGKTEAYLGLIAFVVFLRRLRGGHAGVTVLMRYTLRLLTIQQFARATLLICACERLRRTRGDLGAGPIAIGLWVGRGGTPNSRDDAVDAVKTLKKGGTPARGNPMQLSACPWCGRKLSSERFWMGDHPPRLVIGCQSPTCDFGKGLPVYVVDDDIYDYRPTLLIATSDKFASMPWQERCKSLFNYDSDDGPPELVIQDELHLISGPLGTLAGLYETAIDLLCDRRGPRPKVIASTATIRRADRQTTALFDRRMVQFPPPGLDARDSYFATEASTESRGDRMYVGLMAPATSHATLMIRAYARLLQQVGESEAADLVRDPYWTVLGYFNSLRVLGGARMQVQDDVVDRLNQIGDGAPRRLDAEIVEMTSRRESGEIPRYLAMMEAPIPDAVDVVLATNMISVGVDVDRLGLMVMMGQPQSTSEYIQATSRVGRQHPGLILTLLNSTRSRDRSHYEGFYSYHGALYRQVESTSVTPFSSRARDRGLHAVLISVARLAVPELRTNKAAGAAPAHRAELEAIRDRIVARVAATMPAEADRTRSELDQVIRTWVARAEADPDLVYADRSDPQKGLLVDASMAAQAFGGFSTLYSLRDVDVEAELELVN